MKNIVINSIIILMLGLLFPQMAQAQGTVYVSSLSPTSTGNHPVGSNSWLAAGFEAGTNVGGYALNSIQLGMTDASGNPSGFTVMLYTEVGIVGSSPGISLGTLSGSLNPATAGIYTYTAPLNLMLSPSTLYFIVLTSGTAVATGAYNWNDSAYPPNSSGGWNDDNAVLHSSNGISSWPATSYSGIAQFAINATPIPEPGVLSLLGLGGLGLLWQRRRI